MAHQVNKDKNGKIHVLPDLPPIPTIAGQVLNAISHDDVDIWHLASIIEKDPGLMARIIGIANSAYFACPDKIYHVADAITKVLGLNMVKSLALGIALNKPFNRKHCPGFQIDQYWYLAMQTATLSRAFTSHLSVRDSQKQDCAYFAGLMHNLGQMVLVNCFPAKMSRVFEKFTSRKDSDLLILETEFVGINQIEAGSILAKKWHLPDDVATIIENYNNPAYTGEYSDLTLVVGLANKLAFLDCDEIQEPRVCAEYSSRLDLDAATMYKICKKVEKKKQEIIGISCVLALD